LQNDQFVRLLEGAQGSISDDCAVMVGSLLPRGGHVFALRRKISGLTAETWGLNTG
jgi:hypothetical protein